MIGGAGGLSPTLDYSFLLGVTSGVLSWSRGGKS